MILQPQQIRILHCEKNLARFLFDFGIVDTTKDDYEQVPSIAVCLQQLTTLLERWQSCLVYHSCGLMPSWSWGRINICTVPSKRIWNNTTLRSPKQQIWLRTALCGGWCRQMALLNRKSCMPETTMTAAIHIACLPYSSQSIKQIKHLYHPSSWANQTLHCTETTHQQCTACHNCVLSIRSSVNNQLWKFNNRLRNKLRFISLDGIIDTSDTDSQSEYTESTQQYV